MRKETEKKGIGNRLEIQKEVLKKVLKEVSAESVEGKERKLKVRKRKGDKLKI